MITACLKWCNWLFDRFLTNVEMEKLQSSQQEEQKDVTHQSIGRIRQHQA